MARRHLWVEPLHEALPAARLLACRAGAGFAAGNSSTWRASRRRLEVRMTSSLRVLVPAGMALIAALAGSQVNARGAADAGWDAKAAAAYLDGRAEWWTTWPNAARDRGTYCMSCHTTLPYALARPELRGLLERTWAIASQKDKIVGNLLTRARSWREVEPWYPDQTRYSEDQRVPGDRVGDECRRAQPPGRPGWQAERRHADRPWRDVGASDEDRSGSRRVDMAELQDGSVGVAELAVPRRVDRGAGGWFGAEGYVARRILPIG